MADKSVKQIAKEYGKSIKTVQGGIRDKQLKARKNSKGYWMIKDKDAHNYFAPPDPHYWISFPEIMEGYNVSRDWLTYHRDELDLKSCRWKTTYYAFIEVWSPYLKREVKRSSHSPEDTEFKKSAVITINNSRGIHCRPAHVICALCRKYRDTSLTIRYHGEVWQYDKGDREAELIALEIHSREKIKVVASGIRCANLLSDIKKEAFNRFDVT